MSEVSIYETSTEVIDRKLDAIISTNEKLINLCEKNAEEITYLHKKIDELSENKPLKGSRLLYHNPITEEELILNINKGIFDPYLEGKEVILKEDYAHHIWIIIRVNEDSYDLWYNGSIGKAEWKGSGDDRYWINNGSVDTYYIRGICTYYKPRLSRGIRDKLKTGLNRNCGSDAIVILSAKQLGYTGRDYLNDDNITIPYFNSNNKRNIGQTYWTSSANSNASNLLWSVFSDGSFYHYDCNGSHAVVPAIRVGI